MASQKQQPFSLLERFSLIFLVASFLLCVYLITVGAKHILDGDASSEMVLSNLLSKENAIISKNWFYSTELRVINTQLIYAPLFKIINSWYWVRVVGATILNALLVCSYLFMMRPTNVKRFARYSSAALLLLPLSIPQARIVNLHTYYIPHIVISFLLLGFVFRMKNVNTGKYNLSHVILFLLLSFFSGLGGVRQLMVTLAPLFLTLFVQAYTKNTTYSRNLKEDILKIWTDKTFIISIGGLSANMTGIIINVSLLFKEYHFSTQIKAHMADLSITRILEVFQAFFYLLGFRSNSRLFSFAGMLSIGAVALFVLIFILSINYFRHAFTHSKEPSSENSSRFLWCFFIMSFFVNTFLFIFTDAFFYELYYLPVVIMLVPLVGTLLSSNTTPIPKFPHLTGTIVLLFFVLNGLFNVEYLILRPKDRQNIRYGGLAYENVHLVEQLRGPLHFLKEQGIKQGYATFWHANVVREMSNGEIDCTGINFPQISIYHWLTETYKANILSRDGSSFLLLTTNEYQHSPSLPLYEQDATKISTTNATSKELGQVQYSDDNFIIIVFQNDHIAQKIIHSSDT